MVRQSHGGSGSQGRALVIDWPWMLTWSPLAAGAYDVGALRQQADLIAGKLAEPPSTKKQLTLTLPTIVSAGAARAPEGSSGTGDEPCPRDVEC